MTELQVTIIVVEEVYRVGNNNTYCQLFYKLKLPLHNDARTYGTYSSGDTLPFGPNLKFKRRSYATAHAGENPYVDNWHFTFNL